MLAIAVLLAASVIATGIASARGANGILASGNAMVMGFSGVKVPAAPARGTGPADLTEIDLSGPSARIARRRCPQGETFVNGTCCPKGKICQKIPPLPCPLGETLVNGICCPYGKLCAQIPRPPRHRWRARPPQREPPHIRRATPRRPAVVRPGAHRR